MKPKLNNPENERETFSLGSHHSFLGSKYTRRRISSYKLCCDGLTVKGAQKRVAQQTKPEAYSLIKGQGFSFPVGILISSSCPNKISVGIRRQNWIKDVWRTTPIYILSFHFNWVRPKILHPFLSLSLHLIQHVLTMRQSQFAIVVILFL